jgi:hypothetical protein
MSQAETEDYARGMYERVNAMWLHRGPKIFDGSCGFSILSGPPVFRTELMIIGENPGFGASDHTPHVEATWPEHSHMLDAEWPLAKRLHSIFDSGGQLILLHKAVQTNFQFFKSISIKKPSRYRWYDVPVALRDELGCFCRQELAGLVKVSEPKAILVLGIGSFDQHATDADTKLGDRSGKRRLLVEGLVFDVPAYGILHPTGAQVSLNDWLRVMRHIGIAFPST